MKRRDFIEGLTGGAALGAGAAGLGLGGAAGVASAAPAGAGNAARPPLPAIPPGVGRKLLVNKPRAYDVLARYGLDGMVALNPINVYYLTNTVTIGTRMRWEYPAFATFARDPSQPNFLVTTNAQAWDVVNGDREVPQLITFSGASNWQEYVNATPEKLREEPKAAVRGYAVREDVPYTSREQRWIDSQRTNNVNAAATPAWALARALRESGLSKGRIAVDDMRIKVLLDQIGMTDVQCVPGDGIFRMIRMVKSEPELALQRIGAHNNAVAAMNTIRSIEPGMRFEDVENRFRMECAARGNDLTFLIAGVTLGFFPSGVAEKGKPFLVDAVSRFREYHGDFARTVCIGEPSKEILDRARANRIGREAVFEIVKPGVRFSELTRTAREAMVKAGMPEQILVISPHTVGLQHTDHPTRLDVPFGAPMDHVLEENMTLTIDLPYIEVGWGAGHNEDLIRVTRTGYELMNEESDPLVVV